MTEFDLPKQLALFIISTILAGLTIRLAIPLAHISGILDRPGEHKQHKHLTPFVGGTGIFVSLLAALPLLGYLYPEQSVKWLGLGISSSIIFIMGLIDDIIYLHFKTRLVIQALSALIIVLVSEVILIDIGNLPFGEILALPGIAATFTIFAIIGSINAFNMIDGIDGLSGSVSLTSLLLLGIVALATGHQSSLIIIIALIGGVVGFLFFNLRRPLQPRAKVFLGDNGSMLLGLLITWLLIDLSQGSSRAMTPVTALWLFAVPLMDTISIMLRRIWQHKSPFKPDRNHFHHILLDAGYRVNDAVFTITSVQLLFGLTGLAGLYLGIHEQVMLLAFLVLFFGYFYLTLYPWHLITALRYLHTFRGLIPTESRGFFLGSYTAEEAKNIVHMISQELRPSLDSLIHVIKNKTSANDTEKYAVIVNIRLLDTDTKTMKNEIGSFIASAQKHINERCHIQLRPFIERNPQNDRRKLSERDNSYGGRRLADSRKDNQKLLIFEAIYDQDSIAEQNSTDNQPNKENS